MQKIIKHKKIIGFMVILAISFFCIPCNVKAKDQRVVRVGFAEFAGLSEINEDGTYGGFNVINLKTHYFPY